MKLIVVLLLLFTFCLLSRNSYSQNFHTRSNRALKLYDEGVKAYEYLYLGQAEENFKEAIAIDKTFYEAYIMLGDLLSKQKRFSEASFNYKTAVKLDSLFFKPVFFTLATAEMMSGEYQNALIHFDVYLAQEGMSAKNRIVAEKNVINCKFAIDAMKSPVPFNPETVGNMINTKDDEYWPSITADGNKMMFTRQKVAGEKASNSNSIHEDFYISLLISNSWNKAYNAGYPLNTSQNEGAQSLSSDGNYMFFAACERSGGLGSCDIYYSSYNNGNWSVPG